MEGFPRIEDYHSTPSKNISSNQKRKSNRVNKSNSISVDPNIGFNHSRNRILHQCSSCNLEFESFSQLKIHEKKFCRITKKSHAVDILNKRIDNKKKNNGEYQLDVLLKDLKIIRKNERSNSFNDNDKKKINLNLNEERKERIIRSTSSNKPLTSPSSILYNTSNESKLEKLMKLKEKAILEDDEETLIKIQKILNKISSKDLRAKSMRRRNLNNSFIDEDENQMVPFGGGGGNTKFTTPQKNNFLHNNNNHNHFSSPYQHNNHPMNFSNNMNFRKAPYHPMCSPQIPMYSPYNQNPYFSQLYPPIQHHQTPTKKEEEKKKEDINSNKETLLFITNLVEKLFNKKEEEQKKRELEILNQINELKKIKEKEIIEKVKEDLNKNKNKNNNNNNNNNNSLLPAGQASQLYKMIREQINQTELLLQKHELENQKLTKTMKRSLLRKYSKGVDSDEEFEDDEEYYGRRRKKKEKKKEEVVVEEEDPLIKQQREHQMELAKMEFEREKIERENKLNEMKFELEKKRMAKEKEEKEIAEKKRKEEKEKKQLEKKRIQIEMAKKEGVSLDERIVEQKKGFVVIFDFITGIPMATKYNFLKVAFGIFFKKNSLKFYRPPTPHAIQKMKGRCIFAYQKGFGEDIIEPKPGIKFIIQIQAQKEFEKGTKVNAYAWTVVNIYNKDNKQSVKLNEGVFKVPLYIGKTNALAKPEDIEIKSTRKPNHFLFLRIVPQEEFVSSSYNFPIDPDVTIHKYQEPSNQYKYVKYNQQVYNREVFKKNNLTSGLPIVNRGNQSVSRTGSIPPQYNPDFSVPKPKQKQPEIERIDIGFLIDDIRNVIVSKNYYVFIKVKLYHGNNISKSKKNIDHVMETKPLLSHSSNKYRWQERTFFSDYIKNPNAFAIVEVFMKDENDMQKILYWSKIKLFQFDYKKLSEGEFRKPLMSPPVNLSLVKLPELDNLNLPYISGTLFKRGKEPEIIFFTQPKPEIEINNELELQKQKEEKEKQEKLLKEQQEKILKEQKILEEKERLEKERLEKERLEKERLEKEKIEQERLKMEKLLEKNEFQQNNGFLPDPNNSTEFLPENNNEIPNNNNITAEENLEKKEEEENVGDENEEDIDIISWVNEDYKEEPKKKINESIIYPKQFFIEKKNPHSRQELKFNGEDAFIVYVDSGRHFPDNVTVSKVILTIRDKDFNKLEISKGKKYISEVQHINSAILNPLYHLSEEISSINDPSATILITIETIHRPIKKDHTPCILGYSVLGLFHFLKIIRNKRKGTRKEINVQPGTEEDVDEEMEEKNEGEEEKEKGENEGEEKKKKKEKRLYFNEGCFQLPIYTTGLDLEEVFSMNKNHKKSDRNLVKKKTPSKLFSNFTQKFDEHFFDDVPKIPCASLLVRLKKNPINKRTKKVVSRSKFRDAAWNENGLLEKAPVYEWGLYDSTSCVDTIVENIPYREILENRKVVLGKHIFKGKSNQEEFKETLKKHLKYSEKKEIIDYRYFSNYIPEEGFRFSIDGIQNLQKNFGMVKVISSFTYKEDNRFESDEPDEEDPKIYWTRDHDLTSAQRCPRFVDEPILERNIPFKRDRKDRKYVQLLLEVVKINTEGFFKKSKVARHIGFAVFNLFLHKMYDFETDEPKENEDDEDGEFEDDEDDEFEDEKFVYLNAGRWLVPVFTLRKDLVPNSMMLQELSTRTVDEIYRMGDFYEYGFKPILGCSVLLRILQPTSYKNQIDVRLAIQDYDPANYFPFLLPEKNQHYLKYSHKTPRLEKLVKSKQSDEDFLKEHNDVIEECLLTTLLPHKKKKKKKKK